MRSVSKWHAALAAALAISMVLLLAACGGGSSSSSSNEPSSEENAPAESEGTEPASSESEKPEAEGSEGSGSDGYAKAQADFKEFEEPATFESLPPVKKPIPEGKTIAYVMCGSPGCKALPELFEGAAEVLGWNVKVINGGVTPEEGQAAMKEAVRLNPDGVINEGLPQEYFTAQVQELKSKGIPLIEWQTVVESAPPEFVQIPGAPFYPLVMKMAAAAAMVATEGKPVIGHISVPAYPIFAKMGELLPEAVAEYCSDCEIKTYEMPVTAIGKDSSTRIVNFLRANPDINILIIDQNYIPLGLSTALEGAGIKNVPSIQLFAGAQNVPDVKAGTMFAMIPDAYPEGMWLTADTFARLFNEESTEVDEQATVPSQVWTSENVPEPEGELMPAVSTNYQEVFKEAWGK
jgi:ABC-type sugar transport system substrate-binding protein